MKTAHKKSVSAPPTRSRALPPANPSRTKRRSTAAAAPVEAQSEFAVPNWTFLTNHAHVLVLLSRNQSLVLREVALRVGITERAVQRIISDLEASRIIDRERIGRQNRYRIRADQPLRHPVESHRTIIELLALFNDA